jgi:hypothetical protein
MHFVEPFYNWRGYYIADEDPSSPFYGREYSEFAFSNTIYNFYIHPQWDEFGSPTLFLKVLYADYDERYAIIELIGEWNDAIENDIMLLKRDVIDVLIDDVEDGWIAMVNFHDHVIREFEHVGIDHYFVMGGELEEIEWRTYQPQHFYQKVAALVQKRLN